MRIVILVISCLLLISCTSQNVVVWTFKDIFGIVFLGSLILFVLIAYISILFRKLRRWFQRVTFKIKSDRIS